MKDFFIIPIMEFDATWFMRGFNHHYYAKEYCYGILKIPLAHIEESDISSVGLKVKLKNAEQMTKEDWYVRLTALSNNNNSKGFN